MTKSIILPVIPLSDNPKPLEDLLSVLVGLLRAFGYSDQYTVTNQEIYFSAKAEEYEHE